MVNLEGPLSNAQLALALAVSGMKETSYYSGSDWSEIERRAKKFRELLDSESE